MVSNMEDTEDDVSSDGDFGKHSNAGDRCSMAIAHAIYNMRYCFVIAWPILAAVMAPFAWALLPRTAPIVKKAPGGTESMVAMGVFSQHFTDLAVIRREMVEFRCRQQCTSAANALTQGYVEQVADLVRLFDTKYPGSILQIHSYYTFAGHHQLGENPMMAKDKQSILLQWLWRVPDDMKNTADDFIHRMHELIEEINSFQGSNGMQVSLTGLVSLDLALKEALVVEVPVHEMATLWLPFIILAYALGSARLLLLALISMPIEILVAFGIMYFVSLRSTVLFFGLSMMLMLCTSLSFDYALFALTRYSEERANGRDVKDSILTVISQSGRVIGVSGCVLMISWAAMAFLPPPFDSFCLAGNSMIFTCVIVQITFVPSLLAILPFLGPPAAQARLEDDSKVEDSAYEKAKPHMKGCGFCLGRWLTMFPVNIIVLLVIFVVMLPLTLRLGKNFDVMQLRFKNGHGYELGIPRGSQEWETAKRVQQNFPSEAGILMPHLILATTGMSDTTAVAAQTSPSSHNDVRRQEFFDANCRMVNALIDKTKGKPYALNAGQFVSPTFHGEASDGGVRCLPYWQINMLRTNYFARKVFLSHTSENLQHLWDQLVSKEHRAMLTFLFPPMDPFSPEAFRLVDDERAILGKKDIATNKDIPNLTFETFSPASIIMDMIDVTSVALPKAFVLCVAVCLLLIAVWFRSLLVPLKLILTVVVPLTWTYGAALYVYEDGVLAWTGLVELSPLGNQGMDWSVPVFTLTFLVGLAMDYEIFLIERVMEFREESFGDKESIQLGVAATGETITCAGLIMAFTFSAEMLGSVPVTNQMGFILIFSILVDTFVVRTVLVPAILSIGASWNYWPGKMPDVQYAWLGSGCCARHGPSEETDSDNTYSDLSSTLS